MKYLEKIIKYGLYLLVFLLPWQTRWIIQSGELNGGYSEYSTVSLYGVDMLLIFILGLFIVQWFLKWRITTRLPLRGTSGQDYELRITKLLIALAGLEFFIIVSIFFAPDKLITIYSYIKFLLGIGLFWLILKASYNKSKLMFSFVLGVSVQAMIGIWQFLFQTDFSSKWLGMAMHKADILGTSVIETVGGLRFMRAYGGLDHPNILGGLLVIAILMLILLFINPKHDPELNSGLNSKQFQNQKYKTLKLLTSYFLLLTLSIGLFVAFSRAAWIGLIVGLASLLILSVIKKDLIRQKIILQSFLIIGTIIFILFIQYEDLVLTRFSADTRLETKSNIERMESVDNSLAIIKKNIFFGTGIGNYTMELNKMLENQPSYYYQPVHNVYLLILAEIGIFGFLFFILFLLYVFHNLYKKYKEERIDFYKLSLLVAICVMFLFDHWWWSLHFGVFLFWLSSGFILNKQDID